MKALLSLFAVAPIGWLVAFALARAGFSAWVIFSCCFVLGVLWGQMVSNHYLKAK